jgi:hypothetical protein
VFEALEELALQWDPAELFATEAVHHHELLGERRTSFYLLGNAGNVEHRKDIRIELDTRADFP